MNILFRCDGSIDLGLGHIIRCIALADYFRKNYVCNIRFAIRHSKFSAQIIEKKYNVFKSDEKNFKYVEWLVSCINLSNSDILIMDMRDGLTINQLKSVKNKTNIKIVTIDDPEDKRLEADIAFYPPVTQLDRMSWDGFKGKLYSDWKYVILRKEFTKKYSAPKNLVPNILVMMGGTDPKNNIKFIVKSLNYIKLKINVKIIVGNNYPYLNNLNSILKNVSYEYKLYCAPKKIAQIMSSVDFAVVSFGQTAYELAALKIPAIYCCLTSDHKESSKMFENCGFGFSVGEFSTLKRDYFLSYLKLLIRNNKDFINNFNIKNIKISQLNNIAKIISEGIIR